MSNQAQILEKGEIYFIYAPRVLKEKVVGFSDVERFYLVMHPKSRDLFRLIIVGHKKMPPVIKRGEAYWGFVDKVGRRAEEIEDEFDPEKYLTKTRGERFRGPARPAGEGIYALTRHQDHDHLIYSLELPEKPGPVQRDLNIEKEASYILSVKNPDQPTPKGMGFEESQEARYPKELKLLFKNRKFISKDLPRFLDYEGTQILFISAAVDYFKELGLKLEPEKETLETAEIFSDLKMEKMIHPLKTLIKGEWE